MNYNGGVNLRKEIKTRIEMISRGEVPEGYKRTKVGIIPEDWEVKRLGEIVKFLDDKRVPIKEEDRRYMEKLYPYYGASGIIDYVDDYLFDEELILLGEDGANILTRSSRLAFLVSGKYWVNNHAHVMKGKECINQYFLAEKLESLSYKKYNTGTAQPKINQKTCSNIEIAIPFLQEQQKIAQILSTWDQAIELKEKLIEEKKEQKKGLMQKLLTGEVRLPGFDGEWEEVRMGDIGEFSTSSVNKKIEEGERIINLVNYMDVYNNNFIDNSIDYMKVSASESQISKFSLKIGDVLFTPSSETADDIGHSAVVKIDKKNLLYSYHLVRLRFNKEIDINFKGYVFNNKNVLREFTRLASGATRYTLTLKDFRNTTVYIPKSLQEQKAIAQILSTADKEIDLLNQELEQLKLQKKGLMQLLLTGIIRVKS